jgi:predicted nucleotidyltransferase
MAGGINAPRSHTILDLNNTLYYNVIMRPVVSIRLEESLLAAARERAKRHRRSLTNYIEKLVAEDLAGGLAEQAVPYSTQPMLDHVLHVLRQHQPELRAMGVLRAGVYGSVARREEKPDSDIDILIEADPRKVDTILAYGGISEALQRWIGGDIDVKDRAWMKSDILARIMKDHVVAF